MAQDLQDFAEETLFDFYEAQGRDGESINASGEVMLGLFRWDADMTVEDDGKRAVIILKQLGGRV